MILSATTHTLELVLAAAPTTQLPYVAAWADRATGTFLPGSGHGTTNSTTAVTAVAAPGSSTQRKIKHLSVWNEDVASATVTVRFSDSATKRIVFRALLAPGEQLVYDEASGWAVFDSAGQRKATTALAQWLTLPAPKHVNSGSGVASLYVAGEISGVGLTTGAPAIDRLIAMPFTAPPRAANIDLIAIGVTTLAAGSARVGIFKNTSEQNLYPSTLVYGSGALDTGTTGTKSATPNYVCTPGELLWLVHTCSAAATLRCLAVAACAPIFGHDSSFANAAQVGLAVARTYAALPSTFPASAAALTAVPVPALAYRFST